MRKVILSMMLSLDGFIEGPDRDISWHVWDEDMSKYMNDFFTTVDTILFGRITYQLMADFWPTPAASSEDPGITANINNLSKIVFSKTLKTVEWNNSRLAKHDIAQEIFDLKQQPGKDMVIFGGADITSSLMKAGLIDEYRLIINPVIAGNGNPLFKNVEEKLQMQLLDTKTFSCGNVLLIYKPKR